MRSMTQHTPERSTDDLAQTLPTNSTVFRAMEIVTRLRDEERAKQKLARDIIVKIVEEIYDPDRSS